MRVGGGTPPVGLRVEQTDPTKIGACVKPVAVRRAQLPLSITSSGIDVRELLVVASRHSILFDG
jgi:hypothetical protein